MNVFELFATLGLDTSSYDEGLSQSEEKGRSFGSTLSTVVTTGAQVGAAAIAATATAVVGATAAFTAGITETAAYGDEIDKNSQKLGLSIEKYQSFDYVLNIAGTSMDSMTAGMKTLTNQIDEARNGNEEAIARFEQLGLTMEDLSNMSSEEIFENVIYGFQNLDDSVERTALSIDIFGRSGQELIPLFNMTEEETRNLIETANEYGMVMSEDAVKASAGFKDSLTTLEGTINGLKNNLLSEFLPSITTVMGGLASVFAGDDSGLGAINEGVASFTQNLSSVLPRFISIGASIVSSLATAIIQNAPTLLSSVLTALGTIVNAIIDNSDMIITAAMQIIDIFISKIIDPEQAGRFTQAAVDIIVKLATGIATALPQLIPAVVSVITEIATVLTEPQNLGALIDAALQIIIAISNGVTAAIPQLASVIPVIIGNLIITLAQEFPALATTALQLVVDSIMQIAGAVAGLLGMGYDDLKNGAANLLNGIGNWMADVITFFINFGTNIRNRVIELWSGITSFFTNGFLTIKSKVENELNNIKAKFTGIFDNVKNTVKNAIDFIKGLFNFEWSLPKIKLPHFSITGSLDLLATPPKIPTVGIEWYKKAMNEPYILNDATIFGASGGRLLGGGESGSEMIIGTDKLMGMIRQASGGDKRPITINVYGAEGQDVRELAKAVGQELQYIMDDKEKVYA